MSIPYKCPVCGGEGTITKPEPPGQSTTCGPQPRTCHACNGKGIVWEPAEDCHVVQPVFHVEQHAS